MSEAEEGRFLTEYDDVQVLRIPMARDELLALAKRMRQYGDDSYADKIHAIVHGLMFRMPSTKKVARSNQAPIDKQKVLDVLYTLAASPTMSHRRIGRIHGIDGGRVSEIGSGLRTPENPSMKGL